MNPRLATQTERDRLIAEQRDLLRRMGGHARREAHAPDAMRRAQAFWCWRSLLRRLVALEARLLVLGPAR